MTEQRRAAEVQKCADKVRAVQVDQEDKEDERSSVSGLVPPNLSKHPPRSMSGVPVRRIRPPPPPPPLPSKPRLLLSSLSLSLFLSQSAVGRVFSVYYSIKPAVR